MTLTFLICLSFLSLLHTGQLSLIASAMKSMSPKSGVILSASGIVSMYSSSGIGIIIWDKSPKISSNFSGVIPAFLIINPKTLLVCILSSSW